MYLRTTKRKNKNGTTSKYYQLAHNERDPQTKKPVARIIHSFGRADALERDSLVRLCKSIARVCGLGIVDQSGEQDPPEGSSQVGVDLPQDVKLIRTRGGHEIRLSDGEKDARVEISTPGGPRILLDSSNDRVEIVASEVWISEGEGKSKVVITGNKIEGQ